MDNLLRFPFKKPRIGQEKIAQNVYNAFKNKEWLIIEAPNGAGKTAAILSGTFKAIEDLGYRIFFLTRTRKQVDHVYEEALRFKKIYSRVSFSPILPYRDGCHLYFQNNVELVNEALPLFCRINVKTFFCPFYKNSFHRSLANLPLSKFISMSKEQRFCPIEVLKRESYSSDLIIAPFVVFSSLKERFPPFLNKRIGIIIDEAHNFPKFLISEKIRLKEHEIDQLYILFSRLSMKDLTLFISSLRFWSLRHKKGVEMRVEPFISVSGIKDNIFRVLDIFKYSLNDFYNFLTIKESYLIVKLIYFINFLKENLNNDSAFTRLYTEGDEFVLELLELDPEKAFKRKLKKFMNEVSLIFSSATYFSISSFMEELGIFGSKVLEIKEDPLNRRCITIIDPSITTESRMRNEKLYFTTANKIIKIYEFHTSPILVFFTSYFMLKNTFKMIPKKFSTLVVTEKENETVEESAKKVKEVIENRKILFAVLGGKYSEGIDFPDKKVSIVVIVGLPFPPPSYELKRSMEVKKRKGGWKYAFLTEMLIPTISKVVQASGRIFRSYKKKGIVYLLDKRFLRKDVYSIIPFWLKENVIVSTAEVPPLMNSNISSLPSYRISPK